jgi:hypothetical protein
MPTTLHSLTLCPACPLSAIFEWPTIEKRTVISLADAECKRKAECASSAQSSTHPTTDPKFVCTAIFSLGEEYGPRLNTKWVSSHHVCRSRFSLARILHCIVECGRGVWNKAEQKIPRQTGKYRTCCCRLASDIGPHSLTQVSQSFEIDALQSLARMRITTSSCPWFESCIR